MNSKRESKVPHGIRRAGLKWENQKRRKRSKKERKLKTEILNIMMNKMNLMTKIQFENRLVETYLNQKVGSSQILY